MPQFIHFVLCDYGYIDRFLSLMQIYAETKEKKKDFVVAFGELCSLVENKRDIEYRDMVHLLFQAMRYHLGFHH